MDHSDCYSLAVLLRRMRSADGPDTGESDRKIHCHMYLHAPRGHPIR